MFLKYIIYINLKNTLKNFYNISKIGIMAGASTPNESVEEIKKVILEYIPELVKVNDLKEYILL